MALDISTSVGKMRRPQRLIVLPPRCHSPTLSASPSPPPSPQPALDQRQTGPKDWNEVEAIQRALAPIREKYTLITNLVLPEVSIWESYSVQLDALQSIVHRSWKAQKRRGDPPNLAKLTDETAKQLMHPKLREWKPKAGSLSWCQETYANERTERLKTPLPPGLHRKQSPSDDVLATSDSIVAREPEGFRAWLATQGSFFYRASADSVSWEEWCLYMAPIIFQEECPPALVTPLPKVIKPQYHPPHLRPTVTLEQAVRGHHALKASQRRSRIRNKGPGQTDMPSLGDPIGLSEQMELPEFERKILGTIDPRTEPPPSQPF